MASVAGLLVRPLGSLIVDEDFARIGAGARDRDKASALYFGVGAVTMPD
jgi:hypothetical protein